MPKTPAGRSCLGFWHRDVRISSISALPVQHFMSAGTFCTSTRFYTTASLGPSYFSFLTPVFHLNQFQATIKPRRPQLIPLFAILTLSPSILQLHEYSPHQPPIKRFIEGHLCMKGIISNHSRELTPKEYALLFSLHKRTITWSFYSRSGHMSGAEFYQRSTSTMRPKPQLAFKTLVNHLQLWKSQSTTMSDCLRVWSSGHSNMAPLELQPRTCQAFLPSITPVTPTGFELPFQAPAASLPST